MSEPLFRWYFDDQEWFRDFRETNEQLAPGDLRYEDALKAIATLPMPLCVPARCVAGLIRDVRATAHKELHATYVTADGVFNQGAERTLVRALLPERHDAETYAREIAPEFDAPRRHLAPAETFDVMLEASLSFLTRWSINPHHPVQDFVDYWASALPFVDAAHFQALAPGTRVARREQILGWMQVLHFYRNPRGPQDEHNAAAQLRQRLIDVLDRDGGGNAALAALWQETHSEAGRVPHWAVHQLPVRVLHACSKEVWQEQAAPHTIIGRQKHFKQFPNRPPTWSAMREVVECYRAQGYTDETFDPARIDLVDIGDLTGCEFARTYWGYWSPQVKNHFASAVDVVAYRYRLDLGASLSFCRRDEIRVELQLLHVVVDQEYSPAFDLLVVPYLHLADGFSGCDLHTILCERQVVNRLFEERGLALVRTERRSSVGSPAYARREDAEFFLSFHDGGSVEHAAWQRGSAATIRGWDGKPRKDASRAGKYKYLHEVHGTRRTVDLAAFRRDVMQERELGNGNHQTQDSVR